MCCRYTIPRYFEGVGKMKEFNKMTDEEIEYFLNKVDEHEKRKQRAMEKKKARVIGTIILLAFAMAIVISFVVR